MAILRSSLEKRTELKTEGNLAIEEQLERLEEDIRRLKIDFDIYFNGGTKRAPHAARASLEARISRINGDRTLSYGSRYKLNTLLSKYNSYRHLWRRRLRQKGDEID